MKKVILLNFAIIVLLLSACGQTQEVDTTTETPTTISVMLTATTSETAVSTATSTPEVVSPTSLPTVTPGFTPNQYPTTIQLGDPLPDDQPWLLVAIDWKPYLISEDGEHLMQIDPSNQFPDNDHLKFMPSPKGEFIAINTHVNVNVTEPSLGNYADLYLWSLADNSITHITSLVSSHGPSITDAADEDIFFSANDMAWSHDGSKLAFTSEHMGARIDLYVYDLDSEEILWLTSGPTQVLNPVWSPDDAYILHAGVEHIYFGRSGLDFENWHFFSSALDGSKLNTLARGSVGVQGTEQFLGWISDRQILMHSGYGFCGWFDLRMMDIVSGEVGYIWRGSYNSIAYSPEYGVALVFISSIIPLSTQFCGLRERESGFYLVKIPDGLVAEVDSAGFEASYYGLEVIDGKMPFFMYGPHKWDEPHQWYTVDEEGNIEEYNGNPTLPEQFQKYDSRIDHIYGWVSIAGLEIEE